MQALTPWKVGPDAWADFVRRHPELGYRPGKWPFHNFLRLHRDVLVARDAIRLAKNRFWIGHVERFPQVAFDCATGVVPGTPQDGTEGEENQAAHNEHGTYFGVGSSSPLIEAGEGRTGGA